MITKDTFKKGDRLRWAEDEVAFPDERYIYSHWSPSEVFPVRVLRVPEGSETGFTPEANLVLVKSAEPDTVEEEIDRMTEEAVEHPAHYGGDTTYEVIKVAEAWGLDKDAYLFNVLKYVGRAGKKGSAKELEDLEKAAFYLGRKITNLKGGK